MGLPIGEIVQGDCLEVLAGWPEACVDAVVTDPPYGLHFGGQEWDRFADKRHNSGGHSGLSDGYLGGPASEAGKYNSRRNAEYGRFMQRVGRELYRMLKPGGHLLMFGAPRRFHWQGVALELAGFEIRDAICWLFGSGYPKSLNAERAIAEQTCPFDGRHFWSRKTMRREWNKAAPREGDHVCAVNWQSDRWDGWGTAFKPGWEPVIVARKPLDCGLTVAENIAKWGTGALHVDAGRIGVDGGTAGAGGRVYEGKLNGEFGQPVPGLGRWPANVALDDAAADALDAQTGELHGRGNVTPGDPQPIEGVTYMQGVERDNAPELTRGDSGGASRFFYTAKSPRAERDAGLEALRSVKGGVGMNGAAGNVHNDHPTVKPVALLRWLVRLVTPPGGVVLDPFMGSGSTACACEVEGVAWLGIEQHPRYVEIAQARATHWREVEAPRIRAEEAAAARGAEVAASQMNLLEAEEGEL